MSVRPTARVTRRGSSGDGKDSGVASERVWAIVDQAREAAGIPMRRARVTKGGWLPKSRTSGDTHAGSAVDIGAVLMSRDESLRLVHELRVLAGWALWLRSPEFGWPARLSPEHIHVLVWDEPDLSRAARAQVVDSLKGLNGLAGKGHDPFARPEWRPFQLWGAPTPWPGHRLQLGSSGPAVRDLQKALEIAVDGQYGPQTKARVRRHQLSRPGLWPADGVCGPATYASSINWGWR